MILTPFEPHRKVFGGADLSTTTDLTSFSMVQRRDDGGWNVNWMCWLPEDNLDKASKRDNVPYRQWHEEGHLRTTPGNRIKQDHVAKEISEACLSYDCGAVGFDPWNASWIESYLELDGIQPYDVRQGYASLSEPSKHLEAAIAGGTLKHGKNPIARWCAENIEIQSDTNANIRPVKPQHGSSKRIDPIVATIIAIAVAVEVSDDGGSPYDEPGGLSL